MKYAENLVWKSVYEFIPAFKVANEKRKVVGLPTALTAAGLHIFKEIGLNGVSSLGFNKGYAASVIQEALKELDQGEMVFGNQNDYWED